MLAMLKIAQMLSEATAEKEAKPFGGDPVGALCLIGIILFILFVFFA